jgi:hypothetical protein
MWDGPSLTIYCIGMKALSFETIGSALQDGIAVSYPFYVASKI